MTIAQFAPLPDATTWMAIASDAHPYKMWSKAGFCNLFSSLKTVEVV
jgi:hypothetical protein